MNGKTGAVIASSAAVFLAAADTPAIEPGRWASTSRTVEFDMTPPSGMPADTAARMRERMLSQSYESEQCLTREQIEEAPQQLLKQSRGDCEYSRFEMAGGVLEADARCEQMGAVMNMEMRGTYTPTTYRNRMTLTGEGPTGDVRIVTEMTGERAGDCE